MRRRFPLPIRDVREHFAVHPLHRREGPKHSQRR